MSFPSAPVAQQYDRRGFNLKDAVRWVAEQLCKDVHDCRTKPPKHSHESTRPPLPNTTPAAPVYPAPTTTAPPIPPPQPSQPTPEAPQTQPGSSEQNPPTEAPSTATGTTGPHISSPTHTFDGSSSQITIVTPTASSDRPAQGGVTEAKQGVVSTLSNDNNASSATSDSPGFASNTSTPNAASAARKSNAGAIAGGVLGALILLVLVFLGVFLIKRRRRRNLAPSAQFLNSTVHPVPSFVENSSYAFGTSSPYATASLVCVHV